MESLAIDEACSGFSAQRLSLFSEAAHHAQGSRPSPYAVYIYIYIYIYLEQPTRYRIRYAYLYDVTQVTIGNCLAESQPRCSGD